jgi:glycosyltransferase involved in cell wall biosynthesis
MLYLYRHLLFDSFEGDLIHTVVTFGPSAGSQSALLALPLVRRHPMVITCLSGYHMPMRLLRQAAAVVAISHHTENRLRARGISNVLRIRPGIDLERFRPRPAAEAQRKLGLGPGPALLYAGHHDGRGGLEHALEVLRRLKESTPSAYLLLAMRGRAGQDLVRADSETRALADNLGVFDSIVGLGAEADMQLAIQASTAVIFQPRHLGPKMDLPMTLLEALAAGRPVITSTVPTLCELEDGSPAVLSADGPTETVIAHLARLASDAAYRALCSDSARALAVERYSEATMTARYGELYRHIVADRQSSGDGGWSASWSA